jgi:hypothetical protein
MIADRYQDYMYMLTSRAIAEIGPRGSCSEEERKLGQLLLEEFRTVCDEVRTECFTCSPQAFLGLFPFLVLAYIGSVVLYFFFPPASLALSLLGFTALFLEVVRYKEFADALFPKKEGENVVGIILPRGEVKKRVIVSAHLDSAYEFKIWYWFKGLSIPFMAMGFFAIFYLIAIGLSRTIADPLARSTAGIWPILGRISAALSLVMIPFAFFHTHDLVPGAMDDMAGVSVVAGLGKYLGEAKERGGFFPEQTEVVLVGMSSEEAGLRGAKRYVTQHLQEMKAVPTYGIFLDGIYDERFLAVNRLELWPGARHDSHLAELAVETAKKNGFPLKVEIIPVGATDAAAFSRAGIPSISMDCQDTSRLVPHYHTRYDTTENVRPESLVVSLQMVIDIIRLIDEE